MESNPRREPLLSHTPTHTLAPSSGTQASPTEPSSPIMVGSITGLDGWARNRSRGRPLRRGTSGLKTAPLSACSTGVVPWTKPTAW